MIKWGFYWKLLKQSFIILLISCFTLLVNSSVKAFDCDWADVGGAYWYWFDLWQYWYYYSWGCISFNWSIDWNFNFDWNVFTMDKYDDTFYWRTSEGLKYQNNRFNNTTVYNWTIVGFFSCSQKPALWTNHYLRELSYCSYHSWFDSLSAYLNNVKYWGYTLKYVNSSDTNWYLCVYSDTNYICMDRSYAINTSNTLISYSEAKSEAINNPFSNNNTSPIIPPSMSWSWNVINPILTWDYLVNKCTYQEIIDYIESAWVNKYMCYWWLDNFDLYDSSINYNPIPWSWKTLQQILTYSNAWDTPKEWFDFRNWLRWWYVEMWSSYPAVYKTWFDLYYQYWGSTFNFNDILEYCNILQLDIDYSNTYYNWQYFKNTCVNWVKNPINNGSDNDKNVWVNWDWIWGKTWYTTYSDWTMFIQDYFNTLKSKFPTKYDLWLGFLPSYIIFFLLALVLFRFLAH